MSSFTIAQAASIAKETLKNEREMDEVLAYIENEHDMKEISFDEFQVNQVVVIDEETGKEVYFDPGLVYFCEAFDRSLYVTNTRT